MSRIVLIVIVDIHVIYRINCAMYQGVSSTRVCGDQEMVGADGGRGGGGWLGLLAADVGGSEGAEVCLCACVCGL